MLAQPWVEALAARPPRTGRWGALWGGMDMSDRKPEPWESGAVAPFLTIEIPRGDVEVWALGEDRFRITVPGHEQIVVGFQEAERTADELAGRLA